METPQKKAKDVDLKLGANCFATSPTETAFLKHPRGYELYYEIHGAGGKKILYIMGLSCPLNFAHVIVNYYAIQKDYSVLVLDNRGVGFSTCNTNTISQATTTQLLSSLY